jgi:diguanylate cyclase (GGDEF)-like protein
MSDFFSATLSATPPRQRFRLMRYFLLASFVGLVMLSTVLVFVYQERAADQMLTHESQAHSDLARVFSNLMGEKHAAFFVENKPADKKALLEDPRFQQVNHDVRKAMIGLSVVKVKFFNRDGLTIYSSDPSQVGESKLGNAGFLGALEGRVMSQVSFRDRFDSFDGVIVKRSLVSSYVPLESWDSSQVQGVIELYSDVSDLIDAKNEDAWQITMIVIGLLSLLYVFLFFVVRRADSIIKKQDQEQRENEEKIRYQALHDALTNLPNRVAFNQDLPNCLAKATGQQYGLALMFLDLDHFKPINDKYGHLAGDAVLVEVSKRLQRCLRGVDQVFRIAGDEFTVLAGNVRSKEDARLLAERIRTVINQPLVWNGLQLQVGVTVGIAVYPDDGTTPEVLLKNADAAMYEAKNAGRNQYAFFQNSQHGPETGVQSGAFVF